MDRVANPRAAQYLRMSTEGQFLSMGLQAAANAAYAAAHGLELVASYADPAVSGITFEDRPGLRGLLADALSGHAPFAHVVTVDVSRWGRFQDPDEAGHYEFLCRTAGLTVHYTTESFTNDGTLGDTLVKQLKRFMAAEFSRELSGRIRRVHAHLHDQGFHRGGATPFGFQRIEVSPDGQARKVMGCGERKAYPGSRTIIAPGPAHEIAAVRAIFRSFVARQRTTAQIARDLNARGATRRNGGAWSAQSVRAILANEVYAGVSVHGKHRYYLNRLQAAAPPSAWRRRPSLAGGIVSAALWAKASRYLAEGRRRYVTDEVLLADLRTQYARAGRMSAAVIAAAGAYSASLYKHRFGSLAEAYQRAGLVAEPSQLRTRLRASRAPESYVRKPDPGSDEILIARLVGVLAREGRLSNRIIAEAPDCPSVLVYRRRFGGLRRAYALAGYRPTRAQDLHMDIHGQDISRAEADRLRSASQRSNLPQPQGCRLGRPDV